MTTCEKTTNDAVLKTEKGDNTMGVFSELEYAFSNCLELEMGNPPTAATAVAGPAPDDGVTLLPSALRRSSNYMVNHSPGGLPSLSPATYTWLQSALLTRSPDVGSTVAHDAKDDSPGVVSYIDWKAVNETQLKDPIQWKNIPQHSETSEGIPPKTMLSAESKRKAIISPEFMQFSNQKGNTGLLQPGQILTRRPSKKQQPVDGKTCKCTGKCRNARCVCVKAGLICGIDCKCTGCRNPFVPMLKYQMDPKQMMLDDCLMHNLSKVKDMEQRLEESVKIECCGLVIKVYQVAAGGYTCPNCQVRFTYSWCNKNAFNDARRPRKHCSLCKRCGDYRNQHCFDCGHCYFAGVGNSFSCGCKEPMEVKKEIKLSSFAPEPRRTFKTEPAAAKSSEKAPECPVQ